MNNQCESLKELATALAKAQCEMGTADKDSNNPFFKSKYADLSTIIRASRPALTKYGLSVVQPLMVETDGTIILKTILLHSSGEYLSSSVKIAPQKADPQSFGSCVTYLRRYAYTSMVGVITVDEDDDGEAAMVRKPAPKPTTFTTSMIADADNYNEPRITKELYDIIAHELQGCDEIHRRLLDSKKISSLRDLILSEFQETLDHVRRVKKAEIKR